MSTDTVPTGRTEPRKTKRVVRKGVGRLVTLSAFLCVLLFVSAGRVDWVMAWIYLAIAVVGAAVNLRIMIRNSPDLAALASNRFFSALVRIQRDRGHHVVTGGPYRLVRHPGYAGGTVFHLATPVMLSSLWAFIPAAATVAVTVVRTAKEDRTLKDELDGYSEFAARVRYRLLPGIW